jgi:dephospho-CoA kinase
MLRVGLTGGLGSGKSTVAAMLQECGACVIEADAVGRTLMQPGQPVFDAIVDHFGDQVLRTDGMLDRRALANLAFQQGRARELSLIVHPAVVAAQEAWMKQLFSRKPDAIAVVESALIFEAQRDGTVPGWRDRFDTVILVTAPREVKIARFLARNGVKGDQNALRADAEARIASQIPDKVTLCDFVIDNSLSLEDTHQQVREIWPRLASLRLNKALTHERDV